MVRTVAEFVKLPPERFASWVFTAQDYYRDPHARIDVAALQKNIDAQRELGFLKTDVRAAAYVDMSLVKEAAGRVSW